MPGHDIIVIGASAGGIEAVAEVLRGLPRGLAASVFVTVHVGPNSPGVLPQILGRSCVLSVRSALDDLPIERSHVYVATPDRHLLVAPGRMRVVHGPKENRHRPAIDPMFRSAAWAYGPRVVGVVLTGMLDDGTAGLWAVKSSGGITVVQEPGEALYPSMPANALANVDIDHRLPLADIGPLLARLAEEPPATGVEAPAGLPTEVAFATLEGDMSDMPALGRPSAFTCPACRGALWELRDGEILRYRCHVGHAYSPETLQAAQEEDTEQALYAAVR